MAEILKFPSMDDVVFEDAPRSLEALWEDLRLAHVEVTGKLYASKMTLSNPAATIAMMAEIARSNVAFATIFAKIALAAREQIGEASHA